MPRGDGSRRAMVLLIIFVVTITGLLLYVLIGLKPTSSAPPPSQPHFTTAQVEQILAESKKYRRTPEAAAEHPYPANWTDSSGRVTFTVDEKKVTLYILFDSEAGLDCSTLLQAPRNPITLAEQLRPQQRKDLLEKGCEKY